MFRTSFQALVDYCKRNDFVGWDVFDGLNSRIFLNSPFYRSKLLRLAWIQFFKRSPVNFRRLAFVPQGSNPKGLALFAMSFMAVDNMPEAKVLLDRLQGMKCEGYDGISWGYNFAWQARAFYVPKGKPTMVTTVFVANAFLDYYDITGDIEALGIAINCCEFILHNLVLFEEEEKLCFGYIPREEARIHNANMLGAALLGRVYSYTFRPELLEKSRKAMQYSLDALNKDFSWPYGELHHHQFIDNFHTGFIRVALKDWMDACDEYKWEDKLQNAYRYFLDNFWQQDGCPKYYHNALYPIDIHCSAQGMVTCERLKDYDSRSMDMAYKIGRWAITNMHDRAGYFYYQKTKFFTNTIPYIRWSQAWMMYGLSKLLKKNKRTN
jgi:peptidoglycan/xylan/chitin deacetylase (PgdA/CDA1 family)